MEVLWGGEANMTYFKAGINLEEIYHLHNELRKNPIHYSEYCKTLPSTFDYVRQAIYTAHFTQLNKFSENRVFGSKTVCDFAVSPTCFTFNTLYSVP
jgi:hypothetical protein